MRLFIIDDEATQKVRDIEPMQNLLEGGSNVFKLKDKMRLIIAGSRGFSDYPFMESHLARLLENTDLSAVEIVCGGARGADQLGYRFANEKKLPVKVFEADWSLGRKAGYLRNKQMAGYATHCVCFWDNESRGTLHMYKLAMAHNLPTRLIIYA